jgi:hypothetical protein
MKTRKPTLTRIALQLCALLLAVLLVACGGRSDSLGQGNPGDQADDGSSFETDGGSSCLPMPCPSEAPWNPSLCACELLDDGGEPVLVDASPQCGDIACPAYTFLEVLDNECLCVAYPEEDASPPEDGGPDVDDAPYYYFPDSSPVDDAPYYYYDVYPVEAAPGDGPYCGYVYCSPGYMTDAYCNCVACNTVCPLGEMPQYGCGECAPCTTVCPAGFTQTGPNCGCVPQGVDAGPPPPPEAGVDAGAGCSLEGYTQCPPNSWCSLGTCGDGKTQYGCYCNADGTTTCNLACPQPPACEIPGLGTCPSGTSCLYGACQGDAGSLLYCQCNNGSTYCDTLPCSEAYYFQDAGPSDGGPSVDAGPGCYLEGYTQCPTGSYCALGTCPNGSQYGCTCNADGTTDCNLSCPPPGPCTIPGLGTCPYGQNCTFGSCSSSASTELICYCENGGYANCYSASCGGQGYGYDSGEVE